MGGNGNTPHCSKSRLTNLKPNKGLLKAYHTSNFKAIIELETNTNLMSLDTGASGNLFSSNYFSMNPDFVEGKLTQINTNTHMLKSDAKNHVLEIQGKESGK